MAAREAEVPSGTSEHYSDGTAMRTHEGCGGRIARRYKLEWGKVVEQPDVCVGCGGDVEPDAESVAAKGRMGGVVLGERREYEWAVRASEQGALL